MQRRPSGPTGVSASYVVVRKVTRDPLVIVSMYAYIPITGLQARTTIVQTSLSLQCPGHRV